LVKQVTEKALPIAQFLYPGYDLVFMFDNATSHSVYAEDALRVANMCLGEGHRQSFLRPGWHQHPVSGAIESAYVDMGARSTWNSWSHETGPERDQNRSPGTRIVVRERVTIGMQETQV